MTPREHSEHAGLPSGTATAADRKALLWLTALVWWVLPGCEIALQQPAAPAPAMHDVSCLAVLPFINHSRVDGAGFSVAQEIASELLTSARFNVLEPMEATRILQSVGVHADASADSTALQAYGEALGVEGLVVGSVTDFALGGDKSIPGDKPRVTFEYRVIGVKTGASLWAATVTAHDEPILLGLPSTRSLLSRRATSATLAPVIDSRPQVALPRDVCWRPLAPDAEDNAADDSIDTARLATYLARGGETPITLATQLYLNPKRLDLILAANPHVKPDEVLRRGTRVVLPRYVDHTVAPGETLADVALAELGHAGYSTLVYLNNREMLEPTAGTQTGAARAGVVIDARSTWSLYDLVGSVADLFVVVNGVPRVFPRAQARLRWLVYGRKLPMKGDLPADESFFETSVELAEYVDHWWIEVRDESFAEVGVIRGKGAPPERVPLTGTFAGGKRLQAHKQYFYQLHVAYRDNTQVASVIESFGTDIQVGTREVAPQATIADQELTVQDGRFAKRFDSEKLAGVLPVKLVAADGSSGLGLFTIPTVEVMRPTRMEILEVGVSSDIYRFPPIEIVDGRFDLQQLDRADITFTLTGRTERANTVVLDGIDVAVDNTGMFRQTLHLRRGTNLFSLLVRSPEGSQTFLQHEIALHTRGPAGEPWEFAPGQAKGSAVRANERLSESTVLKVPLLRVPLAPRASIHEALFESQDKKD